MVFWVHTLIIISTNISLEPYIAKQDTCFRQAIPSRTRVIAYLLFVTQGSTYLSISMQLGIGVRTVCKCIHECTYAICQHMYEVYIRLPTAIEARINMEKWKQQMQGFPGMYGAIDGTHIAIKKPCDDGSNYFNRKSRYSINMQGSNSNNIVLIIIALVDYKKRFLDLEVGWPGSVGDSRIFQNSHLNGKYQEELSRLGTTPMATAENVEEDIPAFILGDSAYRNSRHFVTTYKVTECADASIRHLNFRLSKARYCVEHAFGILKGRFQIFEKPLRCAAEDYPFCVQLIASICVLHNFLIDSRDAFPEKEIFTPAVVTMTAGSALNNDGTRILTQEDNEDHEDNQNNDEIHEGEQNDVWEPTREVFLRCMRWEDNMEG